MKLRMFIRHIPFVPAPLPSRLMERLPVFVSERKGGTTEHREQSKAASFFKEATFRIFFFFLSVSQKFILLVSDKGRALGRGRNQPLTLLHQSLRLHPADTPTSPGLGESEMTQGPDVLLSRESADADTEGREHLEFCLFSSTKTSTAQKKGARPWAAPS